MRELKENSIHITNGIVTTCWPQYGGEEIVDMREARSKFNGAYCTNNSTICFIDGGEIFVTPYTGKAMSTLKDAGLVARYFYVPFSNWDYPKYEQAKWVRLREKAQESYYRDYENSCIRWCDEYGVGKLSAEDMENCFRIPRKGVSVRHPNYEDIYYPACNEVYLDYAVMNRLGRFCANNGKVLFVYRDGHTYVTKGYKIIHKLKQAGYKKASLFVPFSNGEQIIDPHLADQWEKIVRNK